MFSSSILTVLPIALHGNVLSAASWLSSRVNSVWQVRDIAGRRKAVSVLQSTQVILMTKPNHPQRYLTIITWATLCYPMTKGRSFGKLLWSLPLLQEGKSPKMSYQKLMSFSFCGYSSVRHASILGKKELTNEAFHTYLLGWNYLQGYLHLSCPILCYLCMDISIPHDISVGIVGILV